MTFYYLTSSLTPLEFGDLADCGFLDLLEKFELSLSHADRKGFRVIRLFYDIENIKKLFLASSSSEELDPRGNLNKKQLQEALDQRTFFSSYVFDFLDSYSSAKDRLDNFSKLISEYFRCEAQDAKGFLKTYLNFEREYRLILTAFRAKKLKKNLEQEITFASFKDPMVESILNQKDSPYFEAPMGYEDLQEMLLVCKDKPLYQYRHLAEYRFKKVREMVQDKPFTLDYLMSYAVRICILEDLANLNEIKGNENLNTILKDKS
jgi:hypothetical protein